MLDWLNKNKPTSEQQEIINAEGNIVITAKPGSGKTFTIVEKIKLISESLLDYEGVIAISFTRKASQELQTRCKKLNILQKGSFFGTIDSFYINQIIVPFAKHITNSNTKLEVKDSVSNYPGYKGLEKIKEGISEEIKDILIQSLREGNIFLDIAGETAKFILDEVPDCKLYVKARYRYIFIDEYQDCGDIQHKIFLKLVDLGLIGIAVGDLDQAIYAFSNRYSKYLSSLMQNPKFAHYEITKNHRCHKSISNYSLKLLGIDTTKSDDSRVFKVNIDGDDELISKCIDMRIDKIKKKYNIDKNNEIVILCRSNTSAERIYKYLETDCKLFVDTELDRSDEYWARLFSDLLMCYFDKNIFSINFVEKYINEDINRKLFNKVDSIVNKIFNLEILDFNNNSDLFFEVAKSIYPDYENNDIKNILLDILNDNDKLLYYKPADDSEICIMTLHKSKGLEFKAVFHLDVYKFILPNEGQWVTQEDYTQALNLHYVGITRAKEVCYIIQGNKRYRSRQNDYIQALESPFLHLNGLDELRNNVQWTLED